jgi:hypothetical protein
MFYLRTDYRLSIKNGTGLNVPQEIFLHAKIYDELK